MTTPKRTSAHLPKAGIFSAALAACLLATLPLAAQDRSNSRPSDSSDHGGGRTASESSGSYAPAPSYSPPPSSSSSSSEAPSTSSSSSESSSGWRSE